MIKCPMPGCGVVIAPDKGADNIKQHQGGLYEHLAGKGPSKWHDVNGHGIAPDLAKEIAEKAVDLALKVEEATKK